MRNVKRIALLVACGLAVAALAAHGAGIEIPDTGGAGGDLESFSRGRISKFVSLLGIFIGAGGVISAGIGAMFYQAKKFREGNGWLMGSGIGLSIGAALALIARFWIT